MMIMSTLDAALRYARRGWPVFPCQPRSKIPATPHGFKDATTDEACIVAWWSLNSDYNVAIATGEASGLYVLDLDVKPGRSLDEAIQGLGFAIPETPTVQTGGGGYQYYFGFPAGSDLSITGGKLGNGIDTRGNGGYVVAPPSIHPNGNAYRWCEFEDAPLASTPDEIVRRLEHQRTSAVLSSAEKLTGGRHHTLMTAAALARGIGMVPREIFAALKEMAAHRLDLSDGRVITDKELTDIAEWTGNKSMQLVNIESVTHGDRVVEHLTKSMGEAAQEVYEDALKNDPEYPGAFPKKLLEVPGTIELLTTYIDATSFRKQPVLALAAGIAAFGALIGRKVETIFGGRSNVYCLGVAKSGAGKDRARAAVKEAFIAAGADALLGPEDIASEAGMLATLTFQPSVLFQLDEIGRFLRAVADVKAAPHLAGIVSAWLKLYSNAAYVYKGKAYADPEKNPVISQPNLCLYGLTVPESLWSALSTESITDGLFARMLVFHAPGERPARERPSATPLPSALVEDIRWWHLYGYKAASNGNVGDKMTPQVRRVERMPAAEAVFAGLGELVDQEMARLVGTPFEALWTRVEQKADQLSLIYACSVDPRSPVVTAEAATWAADLAVYLTKRLAWECKRHVSENAAESVSKRFLRIIEDAGSDGIEHTDLIRKTQWLVGRRRERNDLLSELLDARHILRGERKTKTKPATVYVLAKYGPRVS